MKKIYSSALTAIAAVAAVAMIGTANHATAQSAVAWSNVTAISGSSNVDTSGVSVLATAYSSSYSSVVVNGVTFSGDPTITNPGGHGATPGTATATQGAITSVFSANYGDLGSGFIYNGYGFPAQGTTYQSLLGSAFYSYGTGTFTLSGLTAGQQYLAEFWYADYRAINTNGGTETLTLTAGGTDTNVPVLPFQATASPGSFVTGLFTADVSGAETFSITGANGGYAQLNAFQLETVPEPSTWAMLLGGLGMLTMFRRRRA